VTTSELDQFLLRERDDISLRRVEIRRYKIVLLSCGFVFQLLAQWFVGLVIEFCGTHIQSRISFEMDRAVISLFLAKVVS
jgi:hypothetical protein